MKGVLAVVLAAGAISIAACDRSPPEGRVENAEEDTESVWDTVEEQPTHRADEMDRIVEIISYELTPETGPEFHRIMNEVSVPLHHEAGIDVVMYGPSLDEADHYYLVRSFDSLDDLRSSLDDFYRSEAWRLGPRENIIDRIEASTKAVFAIDQESVERLRLDGLREIARR